VAALGWGTADFLARGVSERMTPYRALLYAHLVSFVVLLFLMWHEPPITVSLPVLALGGLLGCTNTLGSLLIYRALAVGRIAIVSPISSSFAAVTLLLSLFSGDTISLWKIGGLAITVIGVVLTSMPVDDGESTVGRKTVRGVPEALGAAALFGVTYWGLKYVVPDIGPWLPVFESRVASLALLPVFAAPLRQSIAPPPLRVWPMVIAIGLIDTFANAAYNVGIRSDVPGVVAVLGSLFSPVTVVLAFVVLRERVAARQWLGVTLIFVAVAAIGIAEHIGI
jgi:drug/metabolite transporter (DMT)-like permease